MVEPPPPLSEPPAPRHYAVEASVEAGFAGMGEWNDGLTSLSKASGLPLAKDNLPAFTSSFEAAILTEVTGRFMLGLQYDRLTGKSEFSVRELIASGGGVAEFPTVAEANSNAWLLAARWRVPGGRRGVQPYLQAGAGLGSARLSFSTSSGGAHGKGHGFAGSLEAGLHVGEGMVRVRAAAGWRLHRVKLSYNRVQAASQPGVSRYYFDFDDELRDFATGRELDLSGAFARIGVTVVREL